MESQSHSSAPPLEKHQPDTNTTPSKNQVRKVNDGTISVPILKQMEMLAEIESKHSEREVEPKYRGKKDEKAPEKIRILETQKPIEESSTYGMPASTTIRIARVASEALQWISRTGFEDLSTRMLNTQDGTEDDNTISNWGNWTIPTQQQTSIPDFDTIPSLSNYTNWKKVPTPNISYLS